MLSVIIIVAVNDNVLLCALVTLIVNVTVNVIVSVSE